MSVKGSGKTALCLGGNGFICHHLARRLREEGYWVRVVDIKDYEYGKIDYADEVVIGDLRNADFVKSVIRLEKHTFKYSYYPTAFSETFQFDEIYQLGATMGGAGFVFTGDHDADIMHDSGLINLHLCNALALQQFKGKVFYSSSACMYPQELQNGGHGPLLQVPIERKRYSLKESDAYPGNPDSEYGWEKLFSERLFLAYARNYGLNVRIARFHNIYGPEGTYKGGREKAPAAMCRKVIEVLQSRVTYEGYNTELIKPVEVWGTGEQMRSFLYIDDCIDAVRLLMQSDFNQPINIGSEEIISINGLAKMAIDISGNDIQIKNVQSNAIGVNGRNSDNELIEKVLGWKPKYSLRQGLEKTYQWIASNYGL